MDDFTNWMRQRLACYGAVIAIILQQLDSFPRTTVTESPNPLVRIRDGALSHHDWHPDELVTRDSGERFVIVWDGPGNSKLNGSSTIQRN
jgi:hypothetical protein